MSRIMAIVSWTMFLVAALAMANWWLALERGAVHPLLLSLAAAATGAAAWRDAATHEDNQGMGRNPARLGRINQGE